MGVTSHLCSLTDGTADELRWTERATTVWPCVGIGELGPRELSRLGPPLGIGSAAQLLTGFTLLAGESQESPWVISVPQDLARALAAVDGALIEPLAAAMALDAEDAGARPASRLVEQLDRVVGFLREHAGPFALHVELQP